ncbi:MAG: hypothetical protein WCV50_05365 [Patescibacteria group bacterium]|jgi:hypothetical protein
MNDLRGLSAANKVAVAELMEAEFPENLIVEIRDVLIKCIRYDHSQNRIPYDESIFSSKIGLFELALTYQDVLCFLMRMANHWEARFPKNLGPVFASQAKKELARQFPKISPHNHIRLDGRDSLRKFFATTRELGKIVPFNLNLAGNPNANLIRVNIASCLKIDSKYVCA